MGLVSACSGLFSSTTVGQTQEPQPTQDRQQAIATNYPVETVEVSRVIDGDTFVVSGGRHVRVLGIDSCEMDTPGGKAAKAGAEELLDGRDVTLSREKRDVDRYGRLLRYVKLGDGGDYGQIMVLATHTGVYEGGDASDSYVAGLRDLDKGGWQCN